MRDPSARLLAISAVTLSSALLSGCPNPNSYATPRTVAPGEIATTLSLESYGFIAETGQTRVDPATGETTAATTSGFAPANFGIGVSYGALPSYEDLRAPM
ncbi:hypothetical protein [Sorangium sp. So ce1099]|uniref:hypothetical protein n=1 Tax=Sorangium sp. So ce1099 TaxID=3133331 RepID=UPI003F6218FC